MDTLDDLMADDISGLSDLYKEDEVFDLPKMTPEEELLAARLLEYGKKLMADKAKQRAETRKKEDPTSGPTRKISIRVSREVLGLVKEKAKLHGLPYQTYINLVLFEAVTRR